MITSDYNNPNFEKNFQPHVDEENKDEVHNQVVSMANHLLNDENKMESQISENFEFCIKMLVLLSVTGEKDLKNLLFDKIFKSDPINTLIVGTKFGMIELVKACLKKNVDVNARDQEGNTALMCASMYGCKKIVKLLLENEANPNLKNYKGKTAIKLATDEKIRDIFEKQKLPKANPNFDEDMQPEFTLKKINELNEAVVSMSDEFLNLEDLTDQELMVGINMLYSLSLSNDKDSKVLIPVIFDKIFESNPSLTLIEVTKFGLINLVKLCLEKHVDVNLPDKNGDTALIWASKNNCKNIIKLLLKNHANPDLQNVKGETALMVSDNEEIFKLIKKSKVQRSKDVFFGLQDKWWMQIFDGEYHKYGCMVFDEGLHDIDGMKEPGYYANVKNACDFACDKLGVDLDVSFYKELHKKACAHFDGKIFTKAKSHHLGIFDPAEDAHFAVDSLFWLSNWSPEEKKNFNNQLNDNFNYEIFPFVSSREEIEIYEKKYNCPGKVQKYRDFSDSLDAKIDSINQYITKRSKPLGVSRIAYLTRHHEKIQIGYKGINLSHIVERLFAEYSKKISECRTDKEKIRCIADVFQVLEWTHPFKDGQGRTDLILLSKLLAENGLNPPILDKPYFSSVSTLDDWADYLEKGIIKWREVANS